MIVMARRYSSMKAGKLKHTANHIREAMGTDDELRALGASFVNRPVNPIICLPDLEVVDGNRRLAGVLLVAGPEAEVPVCITDERVDESAKLEIMIQSAIHTRGLSAYEEYLGASQWMERNPGATAEQLGERIGRKPAMMSRLLSLSRCVAAVKEAAASGSLGVTEWYELSKCPEQQQQELLAARLSGQVSSRDQLAQAARKQRKGNTAAVKLSKVKIAMPQATVVITGKDLSMPEVVDLLAETLKEARKAADQFDVKTWQSMMRDKAKTAR
jgi:ParB-like chromosome segregation protein Spo0J